MIQTTATDFKLNLGKYLTMVGREEIQITRNGVPIAVLTAPKTRKSWVDDITGFLSDANIDEKQFKRERLAQKHESLD